MAFHFFLMFPSAGRQLKNGWKKRSTGERAGLKRMIEQKKQGNGWLKRLVDSKSAFSVIIWLCL